MAKTKNAKSDFDHEAFEKFKREFGDVGKIAEEAMPKFEKLGDQFRTVLDGYKAIDSKNIKFIGIDSVAMLFKDNVKIQMVDEAQSRKVYDKIGSIDEMFVKMNEKLAFVEAELATEKEAHKISTANWQKEVGILKSRKIRMFDWWKQIFTGKW